MYVCMYGGDDDDGADDDDGYGDDYGGYHIRNQCEKRCKIMASKLKLAMYVCMYVRM